MSTQRYSVTSHPIDDIVRSAILSFANDIRSTSWFGRENEAVSLFAFRHLIRQCRESSVFHDPAQVGIEVAVPQLPGPLRKSQVRKDLVIWPKPAMTCWDADGMPTLRPMAIIEFKVRKSSYSRYDLAWLTDFARGDDSFVGYSLLVWPKRQPSILKCARVFGGTLDESWVHEPLSAGNRTSQQARSELVRVPEAGEHQ